MDLPELPMPIDGEFDVEFANALARYETYNKHHYRPNTYLHKWWGRRCGSTFRLILKGLVEDEAARPYYAPGGLAGKVILDPMMGGGTTLHEAIRLGASVIGVDVDPIPVVQARATLTHRPPAALQTGFDTLYHGLVEAAGDLFQTHCPTCDELTPLWYALYGWRRVCDCGEVLAVDSLTLRHEPDGTTLQWCAACGGLHDGRDHDCTPGGVRLIEKGTSHCSDCGEAYRDPAETPFHARYTMLAVAGHCSAHGLFHKSPDWRDRAALHRADDRRPALPLAREQFRVIPGDKSIQLAHRGIDNYLDLFSSRQLIVLSEVIGQLPSEDAMIRMNLALLVSTSLEFNSMLCGYKGVNKRRAGAVRHTFAHHGYAFPHTALENNPLYPRRASGTLQKLFESRIARARRWAAQPLERVLDDGPSRFVAIEEETDGGREVATAEELAGGSHRFMLIQGSSVALPVETGSIDAVVTDPPYFDSIQYSDLSGFFRVWLRKFLPEAANWNYDQSVAAVNSERGSENGHYVTLMTVIFRECRRALRPGSGRLIFTFHHWQPRAWAALTAALYNAGFAMVNRYVVHAEHPMSVHISNMRALTHDAILVLAAARPEPPEWPLPTEWPFPTERPRPPAHHDSHHFTESCASFLGWVLAQPGLTTGEIEAHWQAYLARDTAA
jgi:putative DNA methylase